MNVHAFNSKNMNHREKLNGYFCPDWDDKENRYPIKCIITNLFATSQIGEIKCKFCGEPFPTPPRKMEEAATSCRHGRGCVWVEALRMFGVEVWQK